MSTNIYKIQGHGKKSIRGNRWQRYTIDRYTKRDGLLFFAECIAWHYKTYAEAEADLARIKADDELFGRSVEVIE